MKMLNDTTAKPTVSANTDVASGGDCVITIAASAGERWTIDWICGGYYSVPDANSALVVTDTTANSVLFQVPVTAAGPFEFIFAERGLQCPVGNAVTVTLEDGSQIKDLNIQYR